MVPTESLSQYLSNEYQLTGVSIELKNYQYFLHSDFGDKSRPPSSKCETYHFEADIMENPEIIITQF
jgi:hypothetical protein